MFYRQQMAHMQWGEVVAKETPNKNEEAVN